MDFIVPYDIFEIQPETEIRPRIIYRMNYRFFLLRHDLPEKRPALPDKRSMSVPYPL